MKIIFLLLFVSFISLQLFANEDTKQAPDSTNQLAYTSSDDSNKPVENTFSCAMLIDNQTCMSPEKGTKEFIIQHRSGHFKSYKDLFGLYGASNISLNFTYGITNKIMIGIASERDKKYQTLYYKYSILKQTESDSIPFSLSFYGNISIDAFEKANMGANYKFGNTLSNFHEIILARKMSPKLSLQTTCGYSYFTVHDSTRSSDQVSLSLGGSYNFYKVLSVVFEYDQPFTPKELVRYYHIQSASGASLGLEINTMRHCFQVFATTYRGLVAQQNYMFNENDFTKKDNIFIGFNITVRL